MTRALEAESHDTATTETAAARSDEAERPALDEIFTYQQLARLDEALTMSSRAPGPASRPRSCTASLEATPVTRC
jgi:hypothetical protein